MHCAPASQTQGGAPEDTSRGDPDGLQTLGKCDERGTSKMTAIGGELEAS